MRLVRIEKHLLLSLAFLTACASGGRFVRSDPKYLPLGRSLDAEVFDVVAPTRPYRVVGTVEVVLPENAPSADVRAAAISAGHAGGCDLLVASALHKRLASNEGAVGLPGTITVHEFDPERPSPKEHPDKTYTYYCGLYTEAVPVETASR